MFQGAVVFQRPPTHLGSSCLCLLTPNAREICSHGLVRDPTEVARVSPVGVPQCNPPQELQGSGYAFSVVSPAAALQLLGEGVALALLIASATTLESIAGSPLFTNLHAAKPHISASPRWDSHSDVSLSCTKFART